MVLTFYNAVVTLLDNKFVVKTGLFDEKGFDL